MGLGPDTANEIADEDWDELIVCQGPPRCEFDGDDAIKRQEAGCVWCQRLYWDPSGRQYVSEPGEA